MAAVFLLAEVWAGWKLSRVVERRLDWINGLAILGLLITALVLAATAWGFIAPICASRSEHRTTWGPVSERAVAYPVNVRGDAPDCPEDAALWVIWATRPLGAVVDCKRHKNAAAARTEEVADAASGHLVHIGSIHFEATVLERKPGRRGGLVQTGP